MNEHRKINIAGPNFRAGYATGSQEMTLQTLSLQVRNPVLMSNNETVELISSVSFSISKSAGVPRLILTQNMQF